MTENITKQVADLQNKSFKEMKELYKSLFETPPPYNATKEYLRPRIAHRLQELEFGGLKTEDKTKLEKLAKVDLNTKSKSSVNLLVGTKIQRKWRGNIYEVEVLQNGFSCQGQKFKSLSALAKHITGTIWNGRKFFGVSN